MVLSVLGLRYNLWHLQAGLGKHPGVRLLVTIDNTLVGGYMV